jgi:hypothetical protein
MDGNLESLDALPGYLDEIPTLRGIQPDHGGPEEAIGSAGPNHGSLKTFSDLDFVPTGGSAPMKA